MTWHRDQDDMDLRGHPLAVKAIAQPHRLLHPRAQRLIARFRLPHEEQLDLRVG